MMTAEPGAALYPWQLDPKLASSIWGGDELVRDYGKHGDPHAKIGESWECWDADAVTNGAVKGSTIAMLRERLGAQLLGDLDPTQIFPVLTKIITAHDWLSVQVHPNDGYAQRVEHQRVGKTECWYVMAARAEAELVVGWTRDTSRAEYEQRVADGTLAEILRKVPVKAGDTVYVPSGMVHAIGPGVTVFETQQASDLTYRLFDWNRVGLDGQPRELHVAKAADVLDYHAGVQSTLTQIDYRFEGLERTALIADQRFTVERIIATTDPASIATAGRPLIIMSLEHRWRLTAPARAPHCARTKQQSYQLRPVGARFAAPSCGHHFSSSRPRGRRINSPHDSLFRASRRRKSMHSTRSFCPAHLCSITSIEKNEPPMAISTMLAPLALDELCVNTLRFLSVDMVQQAESGHPGLPLGSASMAYALWDRSLRFNPRDPRWPNRDRFVLSAGHGCALLYSLLHVTGFDLSLDELKRFRQWGSLTPGHPEYGKTPGVEATTGPLGQGLGNAVGMAIAEVALAARFNRLGHAVVDHYTYVLASDGDLEEGVSSEAGSDAGHLRLGKLIVLYADNHITIEGSTELAFTEDRLARFAAFGWHIQRIEDSNDIEAVADALQAARDESARPSIISVRTHIGFGSPHKQDTAAAHGSPLGVAEVRLTKEGLGWPVSPAFYLPADSLDHFREAVPRGAAAQAAWQSTFAAYAKHYPQLASEFERVMQRRLPDGWDVDLPTFDAADGPMATRVASGKAIAVLAARLPEMMGGSADLAPSTHTNIDGAGNFEPENWAGRNMHFGIREHAMGAILNGMALHRGLIPYGATFLVFSDYMRPPMRLAAMNGLPVIMLFTHDSLAMGEDGPTHQPVEQLVGLRSIPGMVVVRPADANETVAAWRIAIDRDGPVTLVLTRQGLPVLDLSAYAHLPAGVLLGGYVLADFPADARRDIILIATGSEVHLALAARNQLALDGIGARVVSLPSTELFAQQPKEYRDSVLAPGVDLLAIEAGVSLGWRSYVGPQIAVIAVDTFGASAPGSVVMEHYGFSVNNVCLTARSVIAHEYQL